MNLLELALQIAVKAHSGQEGKAGEPYIFHPIRVMGRCMTHEVKIVGLLHDTVEDTDVSFDDIKSAGFSDDILASLRLVTHDKGVSYDDYIDALMHDPVIVEVKMADLEDNSVIRRLKEIGPKDVERLQKYLRTYRHLKNKAVGPATVLSLPRSVHDTQSL
jgi:(p)ppGpp synthase/HD superfamily hydrolase